MEELVRKEMHEALGVEEADPGLRARVLTALPVDESPGRRFRAPAWQRVGGFVAALLGVAVVAGLLYTRGGPAPGHSMASGSIGHVDMAMQFGFKCSLPVLASMTTFVAITLPDGSVVNESISPEAGQAYGASGPNGYDVQAGKWLPVAQSSISPDGKRYAYATQTTGVPGHGPTGTVHVVEVASGKDHQIWAGEGSGQVLAFLTSGVYFMKQSLGSAAQDIWVADPDVPGSAHRVGPNTPIPASGPGRPELLGPGGFFAVAGPLGAFGIAFNVPDPRQPQTVPIYANRLVRMDLGTGNVTTWFTSQAGQVQLVGIDAQGHPIIDEIRPPPPIPGQRTTDIPPTPEHVLLVTSENQSVEIAPDSNSAYLPVSARGDSHGIWISRPGAVWYWTREAGLRKAFTVPETLFPTVGPPQSPTPASVGRVAPPSGMPSGPFLQIIGPCA